MPGVSSGYLDFEDRAAKRQHEALNAQYLNAIMGQMAQKMQADQRQQAARAAAGKLLLGMGGGGGIPMPGQQPVSPGGGMPMPPVGAAASPGVSPAAPPPGSMSPGGGNPAVMPQQPAAPAALPTGAGPASGPAAPAAAAPPMLPPPPFRPMPTSPPPMAPPGGGIAMPPAAPAEPDKAPDHFNVAKVVERMKTAGVPPDQALDQLEQLMPFIQANQKAELDHYRMTLSAQTAAMNAYKAEVTAWKAGQEIDVKRGAEARRTEQGDRRLDIREDEVAIKREKEERLRGALSRVGGGSGGKLKGVEMVYADGDQSKQPIGARGVTATGRIIYVDAEGHQTPTLAGLTAKEGKSKNVAVRDTVRGNLVEGSAFNAMNRLDEIEKAHGGKTTSVLFGQDPKGIGESMVHGAGRSMQSGNQQDIDAKWSSFIDEAIPVFTGGLRGSDAFRRFLIGQAPGPGTKPEVVAEKMRLFRQNIAGTQRAFANKFAQDPSMWGPGVTKEQAQAAVRGGGAARTAPPGAGGEERKSIGGKSYVKRNGQWFEE